MRYTLITGASSGIGEEFARQAASRGQNLILIARSEDKLEKLAGELKTENLEVDFLINNVGIGLIGKFDKFEIDKIESMLILNVISLTKLTYLFIPQLKKYLGQIINFASQVAFSPAPYMAAYAATKAYA